MLPNERSLSLDHGYGLPPLEAVLVGISSVHLCFLPWALGTMHLWSQALSLSLSIAGFCISLLAWNDLRQKRRSELRHSSAARVHFPTALLASGAALLLYIVLQGLNVAWRYNQTSDAWWMVPVPHVDWLPSGMDVPFAKAGPWRAAMILGSLVLFAGSLLVGLSRRKSLRLLLIVLAINGTALALFGILQKASGTRLIFWTYHPSNGDFFSSFIYRNHVGAYLNLIVAAVSGLGFWYAREGKHLFHRKSVPLPLFAFGAMVLVIGIVLSQSRASTVVAGALLVLFGGGALIQRIQKRRTKPIPLGAAVLATVLGLFALLCVLSINPEATWRRYSELSSDPYGTAKCRVEAAEAGSTMLSDRWIFGWGAGCFRFGFPLYVQKYPALCGQGGRQLFWEHVHNDLLEYPIEYGIVGVIPILVVLTAAAIRLVRARFWRHSVAFPIVSACMLTVAHASVDFVFQNPAVLLTAAALLIVAVRWPELESLHHRRPAKPAAAPSQPVQPRLFRA